MSKNDPRSETATVARLVLAFLFVISASFIVGFWNAGLASENGALELATVAALFFIFCTFILRLPNHAFGAEWHLPVLTLLLALRELDFDKRFMETGILKLRLYTGDQPIGSKLIGAFVIVLILACLWRLCRRNGRTFLVTLRNREGWAAAIGLAVLSVVIAKTIDGLGRKLAPFGIELTASQSYFVPVMEEGLELIFAAALFGALVIWIRRRI